MRQVPLENPTTTAAFERLREIVEESKKRQGANLRISRSAKRAWLRRRRVYGVSGGEAMGRYGWSCRPLP